MAPVNSKQLGKEPKMTFDYSTKVNTKRNSKSYNDFNRTCEGKLARRAVNAFKQRKNQLREQFAY